MPNSLASAPSRWESASELEYHLLLAKDLKMIKPQITRNSRSARSS
jgi:hypothetical protein